MAPARTSADEEEDRTVQQPPDPKVRSAIAKELQKAAPPRAPIGLPNRAPVAVPSASKPGLSPTPNVTSKRMTVVGLAPPAAGSAAGSPSRSPTSISPLATTMDKKVGPTTSGPASAGPPRPASAKPATPPTPTINEADEEDASITATAPAPRVSPAAAASTGVSTSVKPPPLPLTVPGPVQIREMPPPVEEPLDETEVRTVVTAPPSDEAARKLTPDADIEDVDDELEDSVTTQAPSVAGSGRLPEDEEPKTSPPLRMPPPIPAAGRSPFDEPPIRSAAATQSAEEDDDAYNVEDSVTTRGPAVADFRVPGGDGPDSSGRWSPAGERPATMSQALGLPPKTLGLPAPLEDGTEGTTSQFAGQNKKAGPPRPSPAGAPSALNVPPKVGPSALDDDDLQEDNRTAVMIGAPVQTSPSTGRRQPAAGMASHHAASAALRATAPAEKSSSESGLRVAEHPQVPPPAPSPPGESLGAMMAGALQQQTSDRGSGVASREYPSQPLPALQPHQVPHHFPPSEPNLALHATMPVSSPLLMPGGAMAGQPGQQVPPQTQQYDFAATIKKPRYGLLVGLVAALSFTIPLVLFMWLSQNAPESFSRSPSEVASDHQPLAAPSGQRMLTPPAATSATPKKRGR